MTDILIIDNFFDNPDAVRNYALKLDYKNSNKYQNWKGYRCSAGSVFCDEFENKIKDIIPKFDELSFSFYFHYTLRDTRLDNSIHKDDTLYAGVVYLTPNPSVDCGTSFYDDNFQLIKKVDNVYNRLVLYPSLINHSISDSFGENIESSRLTFIFFGNSKFFLELIGNGNNT